MQTISVKKIVLLLYLLIVTSMLLASSSQQNSLYLLTVNGAIGPATSDYLERGIRLAEKNGAVMAVIQMDTPGGLDKSTRRIIKQILASKIPIVSYIAPSGARAASAGTFILYASHIAAMAPGTNLGAATPVSIVSSLDPEKDKKVTNDALAYLRSLAQLRSRNIEFAEQAILTAATMTAIEAKEKNVIEFIASDLQTLLKQLDGHQLKIKGKELILNTDSIDIHELTADWRNRMLQVLTDPSIAYILLLIGIYGLLFEFANPGFGLPGVTGAIALLLTLYAFQLLPISYAGLGLVIIGIIFVAAEAFIPSFGVLGIGGIIAFIAGSILLFDTTLPAYQIAWPLIIGMAMANALCFFIIASMAIKARKHVMMSGKDFLINKTGIALEDINLQGQAKIQGEIWQVESNTPIKKECRLIVVGLMGIILKVKPIT